MLINTVENFLKKYNLLSGHKTIIVGFSGGYDSLCLLHILNNLSIKHNFVVVAAHLNHNWRGMESLIEQDTCRKFCKKEGIEFFTKTAPADLKHTETVARMARYAFFKEALKEYNADAVLTAHNKDDNIETIIYRIAKGTGTKGLQGIQERRDIYYRPLLNTYREDIENYCKENMLSPNIDSSNENTIYKRNFIRHEILPMLSVINKNVKDSINSLINVSKDEGNIIDEYLKKVKLEIFDGNRILTPKYRKLSQEVKRRVIYDLICNANIEYDYTKIMQIYEFIESNMSTLAGSTHSLTKDLWIYASARSIEFITKNDKLDDEVEISEIGEYHIDGNEFKIYEFDGKLPENLPKEELINGTYKAYVDMSKFDFVYTLRTRRDGDVINPLGMIGTMKLKKYLNAKKIPSHERDNLTLLCLGSEVLWIPGVGISNKIKINNGKTPTHMLSFKKRCL